MKVGRFDISRNTFIVLLGTGVVLYNLYLQAWYPPSAYIQRGSFMSIFIILTVLMYPPRSKLGKILLAVFTLMALVGSLYPAFFADKLVAQRFYASKIEVYIFIVFIIGLTGVLTRASEGGIVVIVLVWISILYLLMGQFIPGLFSHKPMTLEYITSLLYTDQGAGAFGNFTALFVRQVSIFMVFAALLSVVGLGDLFTALAARFAGNTVGGPAKVSVVSSALFGMISGSSVANVMATGSFSIPAMKSAGYSPEMAATVESIASTGGMITPPILATVAFIMADTLGVPYLTVCLASIIPAFLWFFTCYVFVHFYALKTGIKKWKPPFDVATVLKTRAHLMVGFVAFLAALYYFAAAEQAAFYATIFLFIVSFVRKETRPNKAILAKFLRTYLNMFASLFVLIVGLAIFVTAFTGSGAHLKMGNVILGGFQQWYVVLLLVFVLTMVLGLGVTTLGTYIAAAAISVPILAEFGFNLMSAHFFVFYGAVLACITPPVALPVFNAAKLAGADLMKTSIYATVISLPLWIFPFAVAYKNLHFGIGTPLSVIAIEVPILCLGIVLFVVGMQGYFTRSLMPYEKILAIVTGLMIMQPFAELFSRIFVGVGVAILVYWIVSHYITKRRVGKAVNLAARPAG